MIDARQGKRVLRSSFVEICEIYAKPPLPITFRTTTGFASQVVVRKANGKWRLCIDLTDLNKACSNDPFPLPRIDQIVDSTSGCNLFSFLDAYSGCHQIFMSKEDEEKTLFITPCGMYCFICMPFGLKSVGSTFARAVQIGFEPQLHRNNEAYMDDIMVKTKDRATLI